MIEQTSFQSERSRVTRISPQVRQWSQAVVEYVGDYQRRLEPVFGREFEHPVACLDEFCAQARCALLARSGAQFALRRVAAPHVRNARRSVLAARISERYNKQPRRRRIRRNPCLT